MAIKVALAQLSAGENISENIAKAEAFMHKAAAEGAQMICFPEMGFTRFFPQYRCEKKYFAFAETIDGPVVTRFRKLAKELKIVTVLNLFEKVGRGEYYNTSPVIDADGTLLGKSQMIHVAEEPDFNEKFYYKSGVTGFPVYETAYGKIGIAICYDRHYPEQMRALTLKGAEIIFVPQAGVTGNPIELYEVEMRAVSFTNQVFVALVNRTGIEDQLEFVGGSFVTKPDGSLLERAGTREELLITECDLDEIDSIRQDRPFLRDRRPELYSIVSEM